MAGSRPRRAKKKHEEEHENHERWLVSYADFMTLLFAFFVVMYAVSRVDNKKVVQASQAIRWAMHFAGTGGVGAPPIFEGPPSEGGCTANLGANAISAPSNQAAVDMVRKRIEKRLKPFLLEKRQTSVVVENDGKHLSIRLAAGHFFDPSLAVLRPEALPVLDAVAEELAAMKLPVRVEGHTDDSPSGGTRYRTNWELSAARAATVVGYLEEAHHIRSQLLSAAGLASTHPVASNDTLAGREANRRIELVVEVNPSNPMSLATR